MDNKTAYPLTWPDGRPRTAPCNRKHARFKPNFASSRDACLHEIRLLKGSGVILSTNLRLGKRDGLPLSDESFKNIPDPGVAVYFERKSKQMCFACDCYLTVVDNLHAINLTIQALRGITRWGTGDMMEAAFRGFAALPGIGETTGTKWWEVLGIPINATREQAQAAFRSLAKKHHPDVTGGDDTKFIEIQTALRQAEGQLQPA